MNHSSEQPPMIQEKLARIWGWFTGVCGFMLGIVFTGLVLMWAAP